VVKVVWTNTWYDPSTERQAAQGLLDSGADIISMHQDTPQGLLAAAAAGKYGIGYDNNMNSFAPNAAITSLCWDWSKLFGPQVQSVLNGTWKSQYLFPGMADTPGILYLAPYGPMVPENAKQLVAAKEKLIESGQWDVFTGPIKDQSGQIKLAAGQKLSDMDIWNIDWLVQGVQATLPKS
jgi:basic membrane protein A